MFCRFGRVWIYRSFLFALRGLLHFGSVEFSNDIIHYI